MNWITNFVRPKIKSFWGNGHATPDNLWKKCGSCGEMVFHRDLATAQNVCPQCDHHMRIGPKERFAALFDGGIYEEISLPDVPLDPLKFRDEKRYTDRLKEAKAKTGAPDAMAVAKGGLDGEPVVIAVQNFAFMGGSLGTAVGEAFVTAAQTAVAHRCPFIIFTASGGARMQEGILSLMQMPRTTIAIQELRDAGLPYLVVLTDPTSGGVTASFAMLGDIQLSEPGAMIAFSGPRVIENTIREKLPEGFQRAEFLQQHGMIDLIVHRHQMKSTLARLVHLLVRPNGKPTSRAMATDHDLTNGSGGLPVVIEPLPSPSHRPEGL
jgi:acetyl-CoA carboxylase carboxyl transferase subunit beta